MIVGGRPILVPPWSTAVVVSDANLLHSMLIIVGVSNICIEGGGACVWGPSPISDGDGKALFPLVV